MIESVNLPNPRMPANLRLCLPVLLFCMAVPSLALGKAGAIAWHWPDSFDAPEQALIKGWLTGVQRGVVRLIGPLPYESHFYLHRRRSSTSPVPWANTVKYPVPAVHFHVDLSHGAAALRADWTASHELSHLLFPYLGEDSRWFAEGIASYLQYQIMYLNGVRSWQSAVDKLGERFARGRSSSRGHGLPIPEHSRALDRTGGHVRLYWGGAAFFLHADRRLAQATADRPVPLRLLHVIRSYVACCWKLWGADADDMIATFDELSQTRVFRDTYETVMMQPAFPETAEAEAWLLARPPGAGVQERAAVVPQVEAASR
jgi:hypothetical protein